MRTKKRCTACRKMLALASFRLVIHRGARRNQAPSLKSTCRNCERDYFAARRENATVDEIAHAKELRSSWYLQNQEKQKAARRLRRHGVSPELYASMIKSQGGVCAVCRGADPKPGASLAIDHDHATGVVRGLLCSRCNLAIGQFEDDLDRMRAAYEYLRNARARLVPIAMVHG